MRRGLRWTLVTLGALVGVAILLAGFFFLPASKGPPLSRRDLTVGILGLGALAFAAYGFDLREWL